MCVAGRPGTQFKSVVRRSVYSPAEAATVLFHLLLASERL